MELKEGMSFGQIVDAAASLEAAKNFMRLPKWAREELIDRTRKIKALETLVEKLKVDAAINEAILLQRIEELEERCGFE